MDHVFEKQLGTGSCPMGKSAEGISVDDEEIEHFESCQTTTHDFTTSEYFPSTTMRPPVTTNEPIVSECSQYSADQCTETCLSQG